MKRTGKQHEERLSKNLNLYMTTISEKANVVTVTLNGKFLFTNEYENYERNIKLFNKRFKTWWTNVLVNQLECFNYNKKRFIIDLQIGVNGINEKPANFELDLTLCFGEKIKLDSVFVNKIKKIVSDWENDMGILGFTIVK
jgi:hypothetical protein